MTLGGRLFVGLLHALAWLPLPVVHGLAASIGWLLWLLPNDHRRIAAINIALCFPAWSPAARRRLLRYNLIETSKCMLELGPLWLWNAERIKRLIRSVEGEEAMHAAVAEGRGAIAITPHLGAWEMAGLYVSSHYPITTLYRPSRLKIDQTIRFGREKLGAQTVPTDRRGVRSLFETLREGRVLGILPDQDPGPENGLFAPFFGHSANTMVLLSRLAIRNRSPVFLVYAERLPRGRGYHLHIERLPAAVSEAPLEASVAALNAAVERAIRRRPEQYLWAYKRFKTRPPGEPKFYARPKRRREPA